MSNLDVASYNRQGNLFFACNQAAKATTALSTTATGLILHNPWGSGKNLLLAAAAFIYSTVPTGAGGVMLSMGNTPSSAATPAGTADVIWAANGSGVSTISVARVFTIATLNIVNVYMMPLTPVPTAASSATCNYFAEGSIVVVPGNYVMFSHITTAATGIGSFLWAEVNP